MISIVLPSRGRPDRLVRFFENAKRTAKGEIEFIVYADLDDSATIAVLDAHKRVIGKKPKYLSDTYNLLYKLAEGDIICYAADDIIFQSDNWDEVVYEEFANEKALLLYPSDNPDVPLHGFVSKQACDALGYLLPPYFEHGYADYWLLSLYKEIGKAKHCPRISVKHDHWHANQNLFDEVYNERSCIKDNQGLTCDDRDKIIYDSKIEERKRDSKILETLNNDNKR